MTASVKIVGRLSLFSVFRVPTFFSLGKNQNEGANNT